MKPGDVLGLLCLHFAGLSLLAFGGASAVIPEMFRFVVETEHWMSAREFTDLFAIGQAAPGPNVLIVTLLGWHVAGLAGALLATLAFSIPGAVLAYGVTRVWQRLRNAAWQARFKAGLAPITVGLIAATATILAGTANQTLTAMAVTAASACIALRTSLNPLWLLAAGAALGMLGVV